LKTGVFLTPGASRTAYQVGALHALITEAKVQFDVIGASSVGALNGAFAAKELTGNLVDIWKGWTTKDVMVLNWPLLLKGFFLWARSIYSNEPEHKSAIDPYITDDQIKDGLIFRFNIANIRTGENRIVQYPGDSIPLASAVRASVAVPAVFVPEKIEGHQYSDGLAIEGCALEEILLETGVDRAFVLGVSPQSMEVETLKNAAAIGLRTGDLNQYTEPLYAVEEAEYLNRQIETWEEDRANMEDKLLAEAKNETQKLSVAKILETFKKESRYPYRRKKVEIIPVFPKKELDAIITEFDPVKSDRLIKSGRADALEIIKNL
jgi:predicted acylesterase/phospholipase RssA